ncbi:hypothetical protein OSB04_000710 [Centaurea solstitialis]|uniref:Uncharacterized protein n=1 Tax=Centaurea solstitialis TaxID=347529 RepID=A0AA38TRE4_9ASTR|nr:hypothetical protein OSB04_000710 [Centaurea solstitialis]
MDLRLLYGISYGQTWLRGKGYFFSKGTSGVTNKQYDEALGHLRSLTLDVISDPTRLRDDIRNSSVFSLGTRARNGWLLFGGPRDTQVDTIPRGGASCFWASCPISIGVCNEFVTW